MTRPAKNRKSRDLTRGSIRPVDHSDKSSYGLTGGSLSDRASVTWIRPVTDSTWSDRWFQTLTKKVWHTPTGTRYIWHDGIFIGIRIQT